MTRLLWSAAHHVANLFGKNGQTKPDSGERADTLRPDEIEVRPIGEEKLRAGPLGIRMPVFLPYFDFQQVQEETPEMRLAYRKMLADPVVKAPFLNKVLSVMATELQVNPFRKKDPRDIEIASFCKWNLLQRLVEGIPGMAWRILSGILVDGVSVNEKVWADPEPFGLWRGKRPLRMLKSKDVNTDLVLKWDQFRNITAIMGLRYNQGELFDPRDFLIVKHLPFYEGPGISDLRGVYTPWWFLDTIRKVRAMGAEKRALPVVAGEYPDAGKQKALEAALSKVKSTNWLAVPAGVKLQVLQIAGTAEDYFKSYCDDLREEIFLGLEGATLHSMAGRSGQKRGDTGTHKDTADLRKWYLTTLIISILNDEENGLLKEMTDLNFAAVEGYPKATMGGSDDAELAETLRLDKGLQEMGFKHKVQDIADRYGRTMAEEEDEILLPPDQQMQQQMGQPQEQEVPQGQADPWKPYTGPSGGRGRINTVTGEVKYENQVLGQQAAPHSEVSPRPFAEKFPGARESPISPGEGWVKVGEGEQGGQYWKYQGQASPQKVSGGGQTQPEGKPPQVPGKEANSHFTALAMSLENASNSKERDRVRQEFSKAYDALGGREYGHASNDPMKALMPDNTLFVHRGGLIRTAEEARHLIGADPRLEGFEQVLAANKTRAREIASDLPSDPDALKKDPRVRKGGYELLRDLGEPTGYVTSTSAGESKSPYWLLSSGNALMATGGNSPKVMTSRDVPLQWNSLPEDFSSLKKLVHTKERLHDLIESRPGSTLETKDYHYDVWELPGGHGAVSRHGYEGNPEDLELLPAEKLAALKSKAEAYTRTIASHAEKFPGARESPISPGKGWIKVGEGEQGGQYWKYQGTGRLPEQSAGGQAQIPSGKPLTEHPFADSFRKVFDEEIAASGVFAKGKAHEGNLRERMQREHPGMTPEGYKATVDDLVARGEFAKEGSFLKKSEAKTSSPQKEKFPSDDQPRVLDPEAEKTLEGHFAKTHLSPEQSEAVKGYQKNGFEDINHALRGTGEMNNRLQKQIDLLDAAMDAAPVLDKPVHVWRGINLEDPEETKAFHEDMGKALGKTVNMPAFTSTTLDPEITEDFSGGETGLLFEIQAKKGIYVNPLTKHKAEKEFLLPRDGDFRVVAKKEVPFLVSQWENGVVTGRVSEKRTVYQLEQL